MATDIISVSLYKTDGWKNGDLTRFSKACYTSIYLIVVHRKFGALGRPPTRSSRNVTGACYGQAISKGDTRRHRVWRVCSELGLSARLQSHCNDVFPALLAINVVLLAREKGSEVQHRTIAIDNRRSASGICPFELVVVSCMNNQCNIHPQHN